VTTADLINRYIQEECHKHKSGMVEICTLEGFLADSLHELAMELADRQKAQERGEKAPVVKARRDQVAEQDRVEGRRQLASLTERANLATIRALEFEQRTEILRSALNEAQALSKTTSADLEALSQ
jgi:hypothetical protein